VREASSGEVERDRARGRGIETGEIVERGGAEGVIDVAHANEDADALVAQRVRWDRGVFERLPRHLEKQALLRIERLRFTRDDAEERGVEVEGSIDEATATDVHLARRF